MGERMRKALIILIVLFGVFLAIGCTGNEPATPNETGTPVQAVTEAVKETPAGVVTPTAEQANATQAATVTQNATATPTLKEFTLGELAQYNGKNGAKAYVAYQGKIYDVSNSNLWINGDHRGKHSAGKDLTEEMGEAKHSAGVIKGFPIVGTLKNNTVGRSIIPILNNTKGY
ncbi:MAG TPA: cytochrome b5 domain-containing protein [Methanosarcina sp.]|nr:cytochrome b5 domain-containing protein [Methanosarcina sp.]